MISLVILFRNPECATSRAEANKGDRLDRSICRQQGAPSPERRCELAGGGAVSCRGRAIAASRPTGGRGGPGNGWRWLDAASRASGWGREPRLVHAAANRRQNLWSSFAPPASGG